jgi:fumarylacetoacetate (FAA) hydrolase
MLAAIQVGVDSLRAVVDRLQEEASPQSLIPLEKARLLAPLPRPNTIRDFYAFEQHVAKAHANRGRKVPQAWYEIPVFYFSNPMSVFGPDESISTPRYTHALDYELEIAAVIGRAGQDLTEEAAPAYIFGYTIMNDWSARDEQAWEMRVGLGPAKGKDFATSLGPMIVTLEELKAYATPRPGVFNLDMIARVNGEEFSRGNFSDIYYSMGALIARASLSVQLFPGDVIGSGTVGTGCLLELTAGKGPWLQPGDIVELQIENLGVLRNTIS